VKLISDAWTIRRWDAYECAGEDSRLYTLWLPEGGCGWLVDAAVFAVLGLLLALIRWLGGPGDQDADQGKRDRSGQGEPPGEARP
jgi:hypothetical protein